MSENWKLKLISLIVALLAFALDTYIPLGYPAWLFYVFPLLIGLKTKDKIYLIFLLTVIALLIVVALFLSPQRYFRLAVINRTAALITLSVFSIIIYRSMAIQKKLELNTRALVIANNELESFTYSVSHDLRAPLRTIKGFAKIFIEEQADNLDKDGEMFLGKIIDGTEKMDLLINDMLTLSRISRQKIELKKVDVSTMVESIVAELKQNDTERKVDLVIANKVYVKADENLLRIALTNVFSNAWKFTSKRELSKIEFGILKKNENRIVVFIKDNGAGFDKAQSSRLFKPFERLHSEKQFPGTGIGLATVKRVVERLGGSVWADSEKGQGATFFIELQKA